MPRLRSYQASPSQRKQRSSHIQGPHQKITDQHQHPSHAVVKDTHHKGSEIAQGG